MDVMQYDDTKAGMSPGRPCVQQLADNSTSVISDIRCRMWEKTARDWRTLCLQVSRDVSAGARLE